MSHSPRVDQVPGAAQSQRGIGATGFLAALSVACFSFTAQIALFLFLRKNKTLGSVYGSSQSRATELRSLWADAWRYRKPEDNDDTMKKDNVDVYFMLRYLKTIGRIFEPIFLIAMPVLLVLNYVGGKGQDMTRPDSSRTQATDTVIGLDTLAFGNIRASETSRYAAHVVMSVFVIMHFCRVVFEELREYAIYRQEFLRQNMVFVLISPWPSSLGSTAEMMEFYNRLPGGLCNAHVFDTDGEKGTVPYSDKTEDLPSTHSVLLEFHSPLAPPIAASMALKDKMDDCFPLVVVSEDDVIKRNLRAAWARQSIRSTVVNLTLSAMIVLWAVPVASTAALGQIDTLIRTQPWLSFVNRHDALHKFLAAVAGITPGLALSLLLHILPVILRWLTQVRGVKLRSHRAELVQKLYFVFLFIQMVMVVSLASFFTSSIPQYLRNLRELQSVGAIFALFAQNLPSAANYFFSYLIMQSLSRSAGNMLQVERLLLFLWHKVRKRADGPIDDEMDITTLACDMPVLTTLACIGLVYCIIAPLICVFVVLSFALIWLTQRYSIRCEAARSGAAGKALAYGGILYPIAIHQTFTGIYIMLICLSGLFFGVRDGDGGAPCVAHGMTMIVLLFMVATYQYILHSIYHPRSRGLLVHSLDESCLTEARCCRDSHVRQSE
ncbi:hypothetical protein ISF_10014 [Cordyceps fumosorosea ARSEF 2679]|uniref:DUF221 domain protein n=1 Tax=Cordyceps fumosorosea (strain ARSEF 2679) TaxID=1081104 RepID=A0A166W6T2_CORFA|nr:hypothetical protein ISF_10014 [Cordyceps fumosorosea ARSEF 2679]OAA34400.1 hypothetical protein ISF_10014 [Cordyceps fumosorosea ARSEF 2679]